MRARSLAVVVAIGAAACAGRTSAATGPSAVRCTPPHELHLRTVLYVGEIADEPWQRFADSVLIREFPDGGGVIATRGWWRDPDTRRAEWEVGRVVSLVYPAADSTRFRNAARTVISEIKTRFNQKSVGWEESWVCVSW